MAEEFLFQAKYLFKETLVQYQRQIPSYSLADLLSGVGGVLGLWAGVSVLTAVETFQFLFKSCLCVLKSKSNAIKDG